MHCPRPRCSGPQCPPALNGTRWRQVCGSLYNGHVAPFVNQTIAGALWYQVAALHSPPRLAFLRSAQAWVSSASGWWLLYTLRVNALLLVRSNHSKNTLHPGPGTKVPRFPCSLYALHGAHSNHHLLQSSCTLDTALPRFSCSL